MVDSMTAFWASIWAFRLLMSSSAVVTKTWSELVFFVASEYIRFMASWIRLLRLCSKDCSEMRDPLDLWYGPSALLEK